MAAGLLHHQHIEASRMLIRFRKLGSFINCHVWEGDLEDDPHFD
jgi:hypothetical protein